MLIRKFSKCSVNAKCYLFKTYCSTMYCSALWFNSTKTALRGCTRGFPIFFNTENLLFWFIKLCKCAHKYKINIIIFLKNVRGDAPPPEHLKIWHAPCRRYLIFSSFFLFEKKLPYVVTRDVCSSVRLSCRLSVRPSSVEISLERGCTITDKPIGLKFNTNIGGGVMYV